MGHTERYGVRLRFECNRVTHLLHRDAGTACLRGARYAPTDPMESAKRALDGSQPVDGARELEPRTLVQNRHLGAPFSHRIRAHENNNVPQAARSRLAPVRWCRAALGGQAGCMAPPVARFAALASPGGGIEHGNTAYTYCRTKVQTATELCVLRRGQSAHTWAHTGAGARGGPGPGPGGEHATTWGRRASKATPHYTDET